MSGISTACSINHATRAIVNREGQEVLGKLALNKYIKYGDYLLARTFINTLFQKGWSINDLSKASKQSVLYNAMKKTFKRDFEAREPNLSDETVADMEKVFANWETFSQYHKEYSGLLVASVDPESTEEEYLPGDDVDGIEDDEIEENITDYERKGNDKSTFELADSDIRTLFRMIAKVSLNEVTGETTELTDSDGLPIMSDSGNMFRMFANELAGINDMGEFHSRLLSEKVRKQFPEVVTLSQLIGLNNPNKTRGQLQTLYKFYNLFTRPRVNIWMGSMREENGNRRFTFDQTVKNTLVKIEGRFRTNFLLDNIDEPLLTAHTEIDRSFDPNNGEQIGFGRRRLKSVPAVGAIDFTGIGLKDLNIVLKPDLDFLQLLGVKFSGLNLLEPQEKEPYARAIHKLATSLHKSVTDRIAAGQRMYDPITDLKESYERIKSDSRYIRELTQLESLYSRELPSLSNRNAKGETQYVIADHNHLTVSISYLNKAKTLDELYTFHPFTNLKYNPMIVSSNLRNFLFDKNGDKIPGREITIGNYNGFQQDTSSAKRNRSTADLSDKDKFVFDFNAFTHNNVMEMMRTEAKSSFFFFSLIDNNKVNSDKTVPYIKWENFINDFKSDIFNDKMFAYLDAELARIASFAETKKANPTLPDAYGRLSLFSFLEGKGLITDGKYNREDVSNAINQYLNDKLTELRSYVITEEINPADLFHNDADYAVDGYVSDEAKTALMRSYIANTFINDVEQTIFLTGDPLFATKNDFHKRIGGVISNGRLTNNNGDYQRYKQNDVYEQSFHKKYSLSQSLGVAERDNTHTFLSAVIDDIESTDNAYSHYDEVRKGMKQSYAKREGKEISDDEIDKLIGKPDVTVTDGAAYTHLDFWRESGIKMGWWSDEAEIAYMYEALIFKEDNGGLSKDEKNEQDRLRKIIYSDPKMYGIPFGKYTYFGPIQNSTVDAKRFDKFAIQPILPSTARNNPALAKLNRDMIKQQLGYVTHKSGTKMFFRKITKDIGAMKSGDADVLSTQLLKEQIKTSTETGTDTTLLTQFISLLFTNLFNNGNASSPAIQELFDRYKKVFSDFHESQKQAMKSIGIELNEYGEPIGFNPKRLVDKITQQKSSSDYNSNVIGALELNEDGTLKNPIEQSGILGQVQDYVLGFIDKSLRRYKLQGTDHVVSTPGYMKEKLKFSKYNALTGTDKMEARVSFSESHLPLLDLPDPNNPLNTIGDINRLNQLLNDKDFVQKYEKFLTITFGRAPIDSPHSMGVAIVKHFFEPTAGSILQLPEEFIKASGIDFDIDKEKVYFPYLTDFEIDSVKKQILDLEKDYKELRDYAAEYDEESNDENIDNFFSSIFDRRMELNPNAAVYEADEEIYQAYEKYYKLKKQESQHQVNELLEIFERALRLPEMYIDTVVPNSAEEVNEIAQRNGEATGTSNTIPKLADVLDVKQNLNVFKMFMSAKRLLGVFAKGNTQNEFLKQGGAKINQNYQYYKDESDKVMKPSKIIHPTLLTPEETRKTFTDGKILLGNKYDVNGRIRQYLQAQKLTSTLDSAKDPRFSDLNFTLKNIGVAEFLDAMGVPFERVVDFLNIPVIRQYSKIREKGGRGNKAEAMGKVLASMGVYHTTTLTKSADQATFSKDRAKGLVDGAAAYNKDTKMYTYGFKELQYAPFELLDEINLRRPSKYEAIKGKIFDKQFNDDRVKELKTSTEWKKGQADFDDTLQLLSYFVALEDHQWDFSSLKRIFDTISKKIGSTLDINDMKQQRQKIIDSGFISEDDLINVEKKTLPTVFNQNDFIEKTLQKIFPVINNPIITKGFEKLFKDYNYQGGVSKSSKRALPKVILNDFLYSILTNFGEYKGEKFIDYGVRLIGKNDINTTLAEKLGALRKKPYWAKITTDFPVLDNFNPLPATKINLLYSMKDKTTGLTKHSIPYNIEFIDNFDMTQAQEEDFIQQIKRLISDDFYFEADTTKSKEENQKLSNYLREFTKDLLIVSLTQAGVSKARLSFYQLIPPAFTQAILKPAFDKFLNLSDKAKKVYMNEFTGNNAEHFSTFKYNNPKYFFNKKKRNVQETWRGKDYRVETYLRDEVSPASVSQKFYDYINTIVPGATKFAEARKKIGQAIIDLASENYKNRVSEEDMIADGKAAYDELKNNKPDEQEAIIARIVVGKLVEDKMFDLINFDNVEQNPLGIGNTEEISITGKPTIISQKSCK